MGEPDDGGTARRATVLALIEQQPRRLSTPGAAEILDRLCRAASLEMGLTGASVTLVPTRDSHAITAASSEGTMRIEALHFDTGEGPTREAHQYGRPVIAGDLALCLGRWPGFTPAALTAGVYAASAFPLRVGSSRLGALSLYWPTPQQPDTVDLHTVAVFVDIATEVLVDSTFVHPHEALDPSLNTAMHTHAEVYQAQGMVMVDLAVSLPEALARMRAHAYAKGLDLRHVARDILNGQSLP